MVSIEVRNASVDFPVFDAKTRSLKKQVLGKAGGAIDTEATVPVIEALRDTTLALGVVTTIDPEILILDEGLGAIDAAFLAKARGRLVDLARRAGALVFASHSEELLRALCTSALWMDEGRIRASGSLDEVLAA